MSDGSTYRDDPKIAVSIFRPVLRSLKIRSRTDHLPIFLAKYDQLAFLNLDQCSIQVALGDIDAQGIFLMKYTKQGLLRAYIILNKNLYNSNSKGMREIRKIAGVHEFVHFIAVIFVATITKTASLRSILLHRLNRSVDKLWGPNLLELYYGLSGKNSKSGNTQSERTDAHFRIGNEGSTQDYDVLFLHLMFSRELFETYFDETIQSQFRTLYSVEADRDNAIQLLLDTLTAAANDKDVPFTTARDQLLEWVHVYMRPQEPPNNVQ